MLSHITFIVKDLVKSSLLFKSIFNANEIYSSGEKTFSYSKEKFFMINDLWICLMEGEPLSECTYNHVAFKIHNDEYDRYLEKIKKLGLEIKPERPRLSGEGRSIYFYDYDGHLFELHTGTLDERLRLYLEIK